MSRVNVRTGRALVVFCASSFVLHLLWELAQMPLFAGGPPLYSRDCLLLCLRATATGDMFFMLLLYLALAAVHRNFSWLTDSPSYRHPATWFLMPFIGALLGIICEQWALATHRWQYGAMPLLPVLHVGVTPVLQMVIVPLIVLLITRRSVFS